MKSNIQNKRGFSLVEIVIYIAIFAMLSLLVINSLMTVMSSFTTTRTNIILEEAGINSMERMSREIRGSNSIDLVNSDLVHGILKLNYTDSSGNPAIIQLSNDGGALDFYREHLFIGNLLGSNATLESLSFTPINTAHSEAIKINMSIKSTYGHPTKTVNFYDTVVLRGSYK